MNSEPGLWCIHQPLHPRPPDLRAHHRLWHSGSAGATEPTANAWARSTVLHATERSDAMSTPKIALSYLRVSTDRQDLSLIAQRDAIAAFASREGFEIVAEFADDGVSGAAPLDRRPALIEALGALQAKGATAILVAKHDRLARDVFVSASAHRLAERSGATILSADGAGNGAEPANQLLRSILAAMAQFERALISTRTRAALAVKRDRGERVSGKPPFGYRFEGGMRVPVEHELSLLEQMQELQRQGLGALRIAGVLNAAGDLNPRTAKPWGRGSISSILATAKRRAAS